MPVKIAGSCTTLCQWEPCFLPQGYRVGSEFWSLPEQIGDELTGLTLSLTRTERGYPEPLTHVGKPQTIQRETGKGTLQSSSQRNGAQVWREQLLLF